MISPLILIINVEKCNKCLPLKYIYNTFQNVKTIKKMWRLIMYLLFNKVRLRERSQNILGLFLKTDLWYCYYTYIIDIHEIHIAFYSRLLFSKSLIKTIVTWFLCLQLLKYPNLFCLYYFTVEFSILLKLVSSCKQHKIHNNIILGKFWSMWPIILSNSILLSIISRNYFFCIYLKGTVTETEGEWVKESENSLRSISALLKWCNKESCDRPQSEACNLILIAHMGYSLFSTVWQKYPNFVLSYFYN